MVERRMQSAWAQVEQTVVVDVTVGHEAFLLMQTSFALAKGAALIMYIMLAGIFRRCYIGRRGIYIIMTNKIFSTKKRIFWFVID